MYEKLVVTGDRDLNQHKPGPIKNVVASHGTMLGFACAPNATSSDNADGRNGRGNNEHLTRTIVC